MKKRWRMMSGLTRSPALGYQLFTCAAIPGKAGAMFVQLSRIHNFSFLPTICLPSSSRTLGGKLLVGAYEHLKKGR